MPFTTLILPPQTLLLSGSAAWLSADAIARFVYTMHFPKRMTTRNQSYNLFVIHCHTTKRHPDVFG